MKLVVIGMIAIILQQKVWICLFGSVELTKNADIDKYGYFGYGIEFDKK